MTATNVFTYGSLMFPEVWQRVTGSGGRPQAASLTGFVAWRVRGESYPGLVEARGAVTPGVVYHGVAPEVIERLDRFEGSFYRRITVEVQLANGESVPAEVYLVDDACRMSLDPVPWRAEDFRTRDLPAFLEKYGGFHSAE